MRARHESPRAFNFLDEERQQAIELLTGIHSSKKNYYPALTEKVEELETSNRLLTAARERAEQLSADLQRAVVRTASVLAATQHISSHLSLEEVMDETLAILTGPMSYPWAAIHVFQEPVEDLHPRVNAARGVGPTPPRRIDLDDLRFEWGFSEARRTGRPVVSNQHAAGEASVSLAFLPLGSHPRILGVLTVAAYEILPEDLEVCEGIAQSLTLAVENAALYQRVSLQAKRLDRALFSLGSISRTLTQTTHGLEAFLHDLIVTVEDLVGAQMVVVFGLSDPTNEAGPPGLTPLWWTDRRADETVDSDDPPFTQTALLDLAAAMEQPIWLGQDLVLHLQRSDAGSPLGITRRYPQALLIPMRGSEHSTGAIVAFMETARELEAGEIEILRILGDQTAVSLENTRLYEERRRLQTQAEDLYQVTLKQKKQVEIRNRELRRALHRINAIEKQRIVQEERARIARELHDSVAQVLYSIGLNLDWCRTRACEDAELHARLSSLREVAGQAVTEIRQSIFDLSPADVTEFGLLHALQKLSREYPKLAHIDLLLKAPDALPGLDTSRENEIYRIVQESLFNVYKHSAASQAELCLSVEQDALRLTVRDDGVGMDADRPMRGYLRQTPTFGLASMYRRAESIGGTLEVNSVLGRGTTVTLTVPYDGFGRIPAPAARGRAAQERRS